VFANYWKRLHRLFSSCVKKDTGSLGESIAVRYLTRVGFRVLDKNWRCRLGELDIVCRDRETIIFVEVKSSERLGVVPPEMRVGVKKQRKLRALAAFYMKHHHLDCPVRFDIISVWWEGNESQVRHIPDAFHGK